MSALENEPVKKVRAALIEAGVGDNVIELQETARSAEDAAISLGVELGSIVKSLVFLVDEQPVMALIAGDHGASLRPLLNASRTSCREPLTWKARSGGAMPTRCAPPPASPSVAWRPWP